jgi:hypothetical protein
VQIALNRIFAGQLRQAGYLDVKVCVDNLAIGPVAQDHEALADLRAVFWAGLDEAQLSADDVADIKSIFEHSPPCISVWATHRWRDRLALWCILAYALRVGYSSELYIVEPSGGGEPVDSFVKVSPDELASCVRRARRNTSELMDQASALWGAYCASTPEELSRLAFDRLKAFPEARAAFRWYAEALPRKVHRRSPRAGARSLRLSYRDATLLEGYNVDRWITPLDWLRGQDMSGFAGSLVRELGDVYALERWSAFSRGECPLLEACRVPGGTTAWNSIAFRMSEFGRHVFTKGFGDSEVLPSLQVGGYVAYREPVWVAFEIGEDWAIGTR